MTNCWLLSQGDRHLLVDAPDEAAAWLQSLGIKIEALLLTHQHFDHVQNAAEIQAAHQCPIYAWSPPTESLWLSQYFPVDIEPFEVNHVLRGLSTLEVLGETFSLFHVPGHSPDSVCFYHEKSGLCACGDTILPGGHGRTDFPGGSEALLLSGIKTHLYSLPDETMLLPGHGGNVPLSEEKATNDALSVLL